MLKKNNQKSPSLEVSTPMTHSRVPKFSFFFAKDILKSKAIQGILNSSKREASRPKAGMFPEGDVDRGGPARLFSRSSLIEIKSLTLILGDLVYRQSGAGHHGRP